ncbi:MAG TPA: hypothetical protein VG326_06070 [Tepidisphaeraceae bacterium]|jgi:hypothetical protein|nr:hypothetical protein [Tepidisphaeraceae bacterium]
MITSNALPAHAHRFHHIALRYVLPIILAIALFFLLATPARGLG